jgi:hypothetical protein
VGFGFVLSTTVDSRTFADGFAYEEGQLRGEGRIQYQKQCGWRVYFGVLGIGLV